MYEFTQALHNGKGWHKVIFWKDKAVLDDNRGTKRAQKLRQR